MIIQFPKQPDMDALNEVDDIIRQLIVEAARRGFKLSSLWVEWDGEEFTLSYEANDLIPPEAI